MKKSLLLIAALAGTLMASAQIAEVGPRVQVNAAAAQRMALRAAQNTPVIEADNVLLTGPDGAVTRIHPVDCAGYLWASVSPDGSRLMFVAAGKGLYITDLNGNVERVLSEIEFPVWVSDSVIAGTVSTDDGHQFSSSQIVLTRTDGTETQAITTPDSFTFEPVAAADGSALVYRTIDGIYYLVSLTLK